MAKMSWELPKRFLSLLLSIVFFVATSSILLFVQQEDFYLLIALFSLAFSSYLGLYKLLPRKFIKWIWLLVVLVRLVSFFASPQLSDDYYRFFWDAQITDTEESVYAYTPTEVKEKRPELISFDVYDQLNSPAYYSVYPPFLQWHYKLAWNLSDGSLPGFVRGLRFQFFFLELIVLILLYRGLKEKDNWLLYALNPLVIIELMGNLHAELFVAAGLILLLVKGKAHWASLSGSILAIASKISPVILLPPLLTSSRTNFSWKQAIYLLTILGFIFFPLWWNLEMGSNFLKSVLLYYQTFEFNGSVYIITRSLLSLYTGYNPIAIVGPGLQVIAAVLILRLYISSSDKPKKGTPKTMIHIWLIYLLCSTTIHPWYLIPVIAILPFYNNYAVLFWSFSIIFSYVYYANVTTLTKITFHGLEYLIVTLGFIIERHKKKPDEQEVIGL